MLTPLTRRSGVWLEPLLYIAPTYVAYGVPAETLSLSEAVPITNPRYLNVPAESVTLNTAAPSLRFVAPIPYVSLWITPLTPSYDQPTNLYLFDTGYVTDTLDYSRDMAFTETVSASTALASHLSVSQASTAAVLVRDSVTVAFSGVTTDTVQISETLTAEWVTASLEDAVAPVESLASHSVISGTLTHTVSSADVLASGAAGEHTDTLQAAETLIGTLHLPRALADTVTLSETLASPITVYAAVLTDTGLGSDALTAQLALVGVLADTVLAGDALHEAAQTVYVVNAETGAVSTYQFTPTITGMAEYQGVLYLAGPNGLYALDAEQDDDGAVVWTLRTGFSNLGTDKLKRVRDANFQARTEADLTFQVVSDRYGQKQEWNYRLPALIRDSYRDGVVKPGMGIQSVYWQFAAQGIGPAEIDQLRLSVEPLSRRR